MKKYGIFGLGLSGLSTLRYIASCGYDFIVYDDNIETVKKIQEKYPELKHRFKELYNKAWTEIDCLILSPGIPLNHPKPHLVVELARKAKAEIICDIEIFYQNHPNAFLIGVTGTNGKSTTSSLIAHILQENLYDIHLGGNIGVPILDLFNFKENSVAVIEVSSYQLDLIKNTKFNLAVLLNITPDHLDRHGSMENYIASKYKIFANQSSQDWAIINQDLGLPKDHNNNIITFSEKNATADLVIINEILHYQDKMYKIPFCNALIGEHNQQNLSAAIACCIKFGLKIENILQAIPSFKGLKHRMQYVGEINRVKFINDSKATNADSTSNALASFNNIIWIAGGVAKEGGISSLDRFLPKVKKALLIGKAQDEFAKTLENKVNYIKCDNLENAFNHAKEIAKEGDVILLSPACASFDQWKNFEARGDAFIEMFNKISN